MLLNSLLHYLCCWWPLEIFFSTKLQASGIGIVLLFGLLHGMGFASALGVPGLPQNAYLISLPIFKLGGRIGKNNSYCCHPGFTEKMVWK
jgi:hypothetical protein